MRGAGGSEGRVREAVVRRVEDEFWVGWSDSGRHRKKDSRGASARVGKESH